MRGLPFLVLLAPLGWATVAGAEEGALPLDLDWRAPDECTSEQGIRTELARIARPRPGRSPSRLTARGRIEKTGADYRLSLRTERNGEVGERTLVANECRSLAREVTLVLAVAFGEGVELLPPAPDTSTSKPAGAPGPNAHDDRTTAGTTLEHGPLAPATPEAKAAKGAASRDAGTTTPTNAAATSASAAGKRRAYDHTGRARAALFLGGGLLFAALPSPASFVTAGGEFGTIRWWLAPRLSWLPRVDDTLARHVEARYEGLGGALAACAGFPTAAWIASACLGGGASALRGRSWGATESGEATAPWYTGSAAVALAWPARAAVSVRVEAALQLSLNEPRFVVEGLGDAHRVPRFAPSLAVTLVFTRATP